MGRQAIQGIEVLLLGQELKPGEGVALSISSQTGLNHNKALVVDNHIELLGRNSEQVADFIGQGTEVPNMGHGDHQADVSYALAADLLLGDLHSASVANNTLVANTLVFSACAFKILHRTKNALAE